jgi:hypothetical protein
VELDEEEWLTGVHAALQERGQVKLVLNRTQTSLLPSVAARLHVEPLTIHGLEFFPRFSLVERSASLIKVTIELAEAVY